MVSLKSRYAPFLAFTFFAIDTASQTLVKFLNMECNLIHGYITPWSVFVTPAGEWRLAAFELCSSIKDEGALIYVRLFFNFDRIHVLLLLSL